MQKKETKFWLRLSRACNNKCLFCLDSDSHDNAIFGYDYLCRQMKNGYNLKSKSKQRIVLSGGEPTLNLDFIKLIRYAKKLGFNKIQTITNGRMFCYPKYIKEAKAAGLDEITFSIHGHNQQLHDYLTGINGSFRQTIAGLKNALALGFIVNIDIVINKQNYKQLLKMIKFFYSLGVSEFDLLTVMPYGRAWQPNFSRLLYDLDKFQPIFSKVLEYAKNNNIVIWCNRFPANFFEDQEDLMGDVEKKLSQEIFSERLPEFESFLQKGTKPHCYDKLRCQYCFINDFCQQLFIFAQKVNEKETWAIIFDQPFCLSNYNFSKINLGIIKNGKKISLKMYFKFYLDNLHHYKSLRCSTCIRTDQCRGAAYTLIKNSGFKVLRPLK